MKNSFLFTLFAALAGTVPFFAQAQQDPRLIQINGVVMTSDSLYGVPDVIVSVKNKNRGVYTGSQGVFAIVVYKGDTLQFRSLGYRPKEVPVPTNFPSNSMSIVQLMSQDTFYLNETIIHALPPKDQFNYALQNLEIDDDQIETARKNTELAKMRMMGEVLVKDGRENQSFVQRDIAYRASYVGQQPPMNIFSPIKWGQFIEAWKRGDFRRKR